MLSYCFMCKKSTENINPRVSKILSKWAICGNKKSRFI